jgi:choline dehydrogenase-like flavoprotein
MSTNFQTQGADAPRIDDPIAAGLKRGWKVKGGGHGAAPSSLTCDVAIVGTGAGAGITAELLTAAGLNVVLVEEGPLRSSSHFRQLESEAYPQLYQDSANRQTSDKGVTILQGRCVGGSTTVNWTSSFRTPAATLDHWVRRFELPELTESAMTPWFLAAEQRLNIGPWLVPPNLNNSLLRDGAARLGIPAAAILRNVRACWNLGSCGLGCPTNAKQSMLVTTLPVALDRGATLLVQTRAERIEWQGGRAAALHCVPVAVNGAPQTGATRITFKHLVVAGGAINSPGLLLRSETPDPHARLGLRTFLHPVVLSAAVFDREVAGWDGAPQTIYSDHFLDTQPLDGPIGYKLEAPPLYPVIGASTLPGFGAQQAQTLASYARTHALLALMRDGFHEQSPGGRVALKDGRPVLDYPLTDYVMDGARRALLSMAEIQFAAGAQRVTPGHEAARPYASWKEAREAIAALPMVKYQTRVVSAHVMGGCGIAGRPELGVVRPDGRHWQVDNLSVLDGSLFPTSIGANPQLSIYGLVTKLATGLAKSLSGQDVRLGA